MPMTLCKHCGQQVTMENFGLWHHDDGTTACIVDGIQSITREGIPGQPLCDFCSSEDVNWTLRTAKAFEVEMLGMNLETGESRSQTHNMSEDWAACDECHDLIEAGKWHELAVKASVKVMGPDHPLLDELVSAIEEMHGGIRALEYEWMSNPGGVDKGR